MNKYEATLKEMGQVAEMAEIINREKRICLACDCHDCKYSGQHGCTDTKKAQALYDADYRKVGDDEIVIKKSEYEELSKIHATIINNTYQQGLDYGKEETARRILLWMDGPLTYQEIRKLIVKCFGIELED